MKQGLATRLRRVLVGGVLMACGLAQALEVQRVEPPSWWVGMREPVLQLMVYGRDLAGAQARVAAPGVTLEKVFAAPNPNYLFIELRIDSALARPGPLRLELARGERRAEIEYELQARRPGSADREGFSNRDVILNLMPDRYANGDPGNDRVAGFPDKLDRADIHAGRHGGDLQGIIDHLDDLAAMGYTAIWPTPVVENNQATYSYHGYAATDLYRIDARFGDNALYRELVRRAHGKGIKVIQDVVLNHIGDGHWWLRDPPAPDWISHGGRFVATNHARTTAYDPYAAPGDRASFTRGWFVDSMPDLDQRNPQLASYLMQNAIWWIEYADLDGLRLDTYGYSDHAFLAAWSARLMREYPRFNMVGEEWSNNPLVVAYWQRGRRQADGYESHLPSLMDFPLREALIRGLNEADTLHSGLQTLYEALINDRLYADPHRLVLFEGNHDVPRLYSAVGEDFGLYRLALTYVLTAPRIPQLYYGTDLLMTSPTHRDDGAFRRDYPGGWPGDAVNGFSGAGLNAKQQEARDFLRRLLHWRRGASAVHSGDFKHWMPVDGAYAYLRRGQDGRAVLVVLNKGPARRFDLAPLVGALQGYRRARDIFGGKTTELRVGALELPARAPLVLDLEP